MLTQVLPGYLDRSVDVDEMQERLVHLRQQLPKEQQDLLNHSWGVLGKGRGRSILSWLLTAPVQVKCVSSRCYLGLSQRTQGLQQFVL